MTPEYEDRLIAFIDFLGFKDICHIPLIMAQKRPMESEIPLNFVILCRFNLS